MLSSSQPDPSAESAVETGHDDGSVQNRPLSGLEGILEQILSVTDADKSQAPAEQRTQQELLRVAADLTQHAFCLDPVLLSMVSVVTGEIKGLTRTQHLAMERSVAASLYEDIASRERLERLWQHLVRLAGHAE